MNLRFSKNKEPAEFSQTFLAKRKTASFGFYIGTKIGDASKNVSTKIAERHQFAALRQTLRDTKQNAEKRWKLLVSTFFKQLSESASVGCVTVLNMTSTLLPPPPPLISYLMALFINYEFACTNLLITYYLRISYLSTT